MTIDTSLVEKAIDKLNDFLAKRRYYAECNCRGCDEAREVAQAKDDLLAFNTQVVQSEAAPPQGKAQASPEAVAAGARALAVQIDGMRFNLYRDGELLQVGYVHEIVAWAMKTEMVIEFRYR